MDLSYLKLLLDLRLYPILLRGVQSRLNQRNERGLKGYEAVVRISSPCFGPVRSSTIRIASNWTVSGL